MHIPKLISVHELWSFTDLQRGSEYEYKVFRKLSIEKELLSLHHARIIFPNSHMDFKKIEWSKDVKE